RARCTLALKNQPTVIRSLRFVSESQEKFCQACFKSKGCREFPEQYHRVLEPSAAPCSVPGPGRVFLYAGDPQNDPGAPYRECAGSAPASRGGRAGRTFTI